jgi:hypothetical protein
VRPRSKKKNVGKKLVDTRKESQVPTPLVNFNMDFVGFNHII